MRKYLILLLLILFQKHSFGQQFTWLKTAGGNTLSDYAIHIIHDDDGNKYVLFEFDGYLDSAPGTMYYTFFGNDSLQINGKNDVVLTKYSSSGNLIWAKAIGGDYMGNNLREGGGEIVFDAYSNSIYLITNIVGSIELDTFHLNNAFHEDDEQILVSRFNLDGDCLWAKLINSPGKDWGMSVTISPDHNIWVTGLNELDMSFNGNPIGKGCFIATFNYTDGNNLSMETLIPGSDQGFYRSAFIYSFKFYDDNLYLSILGVNGPLTFKTMTFPDTTQQCFLFKMDANGNIIWARQFGSDFISVQTPDFHESTIYLTGTFKNQFVCSIDTFSSSDVDAYWMCWDTTGNVKLVSKGNLSACVDYCSIKHGNNGNFYLSGNFSGSGNIGGVPIYSDSAMNFFVAELDSNGHCNSLYAQPGADIYDIDFEPSNGHLLICGYFDFNPTFGGIPLTSRLTSDAFVAELSSLLTGESSMSAPIDNSLSIYANPNNGRFHIQLPESIHSLNQPFEMEIVNDKGESVFHKHLQAGEFQQVQSLQLASGTYIVILNCNHQTYRGKMSVY